MNKKVFLCILTLIMCIFAVEPCYLRAESTEVVSVLSENTNITRAEETRWYFREYNGVKQKRLWSLTYGYWKTDWINCL